jgi:inward rectifier potassium channel
MLIIISFYAGINFIFATIYYGIDLDGIASTDSEWVKFGQVYFLVHKPSLQLVMGISPVGFDKCTFCC